MFGFLKKKGKKQKQELNEFIQKLESDDCGIPVPPSFIFEPVAKAAVKEGVSVEEYMKKQNVNSFNEPLDKLVDGDLPWGWITAHKDFTDKTQAEWGFFLQRWIESRKAHPTEQYGALKSLLMYLEDAQKLCHQKGECFAYWFDGCIASQDYIDKRKSELADLEANMDTYLQEYEERKELEAFEASLTDEMIYDAIMQHEGMLQKDLCKLFPYPKAISSKLYFMAKEGKIERTKSGNSYTLKIKTGH